MDYSDKGNKDLGREKRQQGNQAWWTDQTMSYDWHDSIEHERFSREWFDDSDRRFLHGARLFTGEANPFVSLMDLENLSGKRVLEIGCGMGFHSEMLASAGAKLTSIDLSPTSVEATKKRFETKSLSGDIRQMDAETIDEVFSEDEFDVVWSWGVIHHSAHTARIIRRIAKILKPSGTAKVMVYHLSGAAAYTTFLRRYALGFWSGADIDDLLWKDADGFTARFYTRDMLSDVFLAFFNTAETHVFGQDADVVLLPRRLRMPLLGTLSRQKQIERAGVRGSMIYIEASKPF